MERPWVIPALLSLLFLSGGLGIQKVLLSPLNSTQIGQWIYFSCMATVMGWAIAGIYWLKKRGIQKKASAALLTSVILSTILFAQVKPDYRVLTDEATLTSISYQMHNAAEATTIYLTRLTENGLEVLKKGIDKRPPLFPFLTHLLHRVFGDSPQHSFWVNFGVLSALLTLLHLFLLPHLGWSITVGTLFLALSQPSLYATATSAGFDLLSSFFLFLSIILFIRISRKFCAGESRLLIWTLALFALCRYESVLFSALMAFGTLFIARKNDVHLEKELLCVAVLISPSLWPILQMLQPSFTEVPTDQALKIQFLLHHASDLFLGLFTPRITSLGGVFFNLLGIMGLIGLGPHLKRLRPGVRRTLLVVLSINLILPLSWFFGSYLQAHAMRFFMVPTVILSVGAGIGMHRFTRFLPKPVQTAAALSCACIALGVFQHQIHIRNPQVLFQEIGATQAYRIARDWINRYSKPMIVSSYPTQYAILGLTSIDYETLNLNQSKIVNQLRANPSQELLLFQIIPKSTQEVSPSEHHTLPVQLLEEVVISPLNRLRVSKFNPELSSEEK